MDLIFAEATPPGRGGVSVIRLSGEGARATAEVLVGRMPRCRHAYFRDLVEQKEAVDQVLAIWFEKGSSFSGEEVAELHLHGAPVIVRRVSAALLRLGARSAEAGEFTRRAFLNGRMDLAEIEGLGDLLAAETEAQRKQALRTASGELAQRAASWRALLIEAGALVEVSVDFADEDVPDEVPSRVFELIRELRRQLLAELEGFQFAERLRTGFEVAVVGPPNVGKSSFLNALAGRDVAIVSDVAGTTRDIIELRYDLRGLPITFLDTAGLRPSNDQIETMGVELAYKRAAAADLRLHLSLDGTRVDELWSACDLIVRTHADLGQQDTNFAISSKTGEGLNEVLEAIFTVLSRLVADAGLVSHERQRAELDAALVAISGTDGLDAEILAERLRQANYALDRLLGKIGAEDYLDLIFSSFCIGK